MMVRSRESPLAFYLKEPRMTGHWCQPQREKPAIRSLRGGQAVAEELAQRSLAAVGYSVFRDLPETDWNIDHVVGGLCSYWTTRAWDLGFVWDLVFGICVLFREFGPISRFTCPAFH